MSFCYNVKKELLENNIKSENLLFFMSGLLKSSLNINIHNNDLQLFIESDIKGLIKPVNKFVTMNYNATCTITERTNSNDLTYYVIDFPSNIAKKLLNDVGIYDNEGNINFKVPFRVYSSHDSRISFLIGVFFGCANSNINNDATKQKGTPYLDFTFINETLPKDINKIACHENIRFKFIEKTNNYILRLRPTNNAIFNYLIKIGATGSALEYNNHNFFKEVFETEVRRNNCMFANMAKTIDASLRQTNAINLINDLIGIESLPKDLQETCILRLENPDVPLSKLANLSNKKISKSGLNHRMEKILDIAKKLQS